MGTIRKIRRKMVTTNIEEVPENVQQFIPFEAGFSYDGCKIVLLVPLHKIPKGQEIVRNFTNQTKEMYARAKKVNIYDIYTTALNIQNRIDKFKVSELLNG